MATPLQKFFDIILAGESKTYDDHNYYTSSGLRGFIRGGYGTPYSLLQKPLSKYTIGEVMNFQSRGRDSIGQLWATGRYQIIPDTLKGLVNSLNLPPNKVYDADTQDLLGYELLKGRENLRNYLEKQVPDTQENLEKAALDVARIWSSVGVPYPTQGRSQYVSKNQSYYAGGGDVAKVKTEDTQDALRNLRNGGFGLFKNLFGGGNLDDKQKTLLMGILGVGFLGLSAYLIYQIKKRFF